MTYEELRTANESLSTADIKGKDYVLVNERVRAFRMLFPEGTITTNILSLEGGVVTMKADVLDENGRLMASGLAQEKEGSNYINKTSFIENCETSAVGRALGFLGIGVDNAIASAEEMQNAVSNQGITEDEAKNLANELNRANVNIDELLRRYKIKKLKDLTPAQMVKIYGQLDKLKNDSHGEQE